MATKVTITTSEINLRATSLRSQLTNIVTIKKCGSEKEFRNAMTAFDKAVDQFKKAII
jgi:hypothetical protein